jgi:hypothetical protein
MRCVASILLKRMARRPSLQTPMPFKNRLILGSLLIFLVLLFAICFAPLLISDSVRLWFWWKARQQRLTVKIDGVDAPLLRPVVVRGLHVTSAGDAAFHIDLNAA